MAAGRCNVSSSRKRDVPYPRKDLCSKKNVEFGKLSRGDGVEKGMPNEKKRKVSCDEWSRDDKEVRISSRNRVISTNGSLRLLETVGVAECGIADESFKKLQNLPGKHEIVANRSVGIDGFEDWRDVAGRGSLRSHKSTSCDGEVGQVKGERVGTWKGLTCRWAEESDCAADEDESTCNKVDYEAAMPAASDAEMSSPESGEILGRSGKRWSGCEIESRSVELVVSGDEYPVHDLGYDTMEIDENRGEVSGLCQLDSDSEDDDDFRNHDPEVPNCRNMNMLQGCRSAFEYEKLHKISEGTYGIVYKARDKLTGDIVALKKVKMGQNTDGFPITSLREINILMSLRHPMIVDVKEVVMDDRDGVYVVMEYMEHDLKRVMDVMKQPFSQSDVKCLMLQLLEGVKFLHDNWVLHRDLKTSNLLLNNRGELKICDFGMARQYRSPLKPYTPLVVTLWYRAPEVLLGAKQYSTAVDMWSVGCIMAEMLAKEALFKGESEIQQLDKIFRVLGTPNEAIWPGFSSLPGSRAKFVKQPYNLLRKKFPAATFTGSPVLTELGIDLLNKLLTHDPEKRITAEEALNHGWFREVPLPKSKEFMPTFPVPYRRR